jgi:hypothetical protein
VTFRAAREALAGEGVRLNATTYGRHRRAVYGGNGTGNGDGAGQQGEPAAAPASPAAPAVPAGNGSCNGGSADDAATTLSALAALVRRVGVAKLRRLLDAVEQ